MTQENNLVGKFNLNVGVLPTPRNAFEIYVTFDFDANGILKRFCPGRVHHHLKREGTFVSGRSRERAKRTLSFMGAQRGQSCVTERATICGLRHDRCGL